jgi:hypothetical protein
MDDDFHYYELSVVKITHLVKTKNVKDVDESTECKFTKLKEPTYNYHMYDNGTDKYEGYEACNDGGFYYKAVCEYCSEKYCGFSSGD